MDTKLLKTIGRRFALWIIIPLLLVSCIEGKLQEAEKPLLVTVSDLEPYGYKLENPENTGEAKRSIFMDGAMSFEYEYTSKTGAKKFIYMTTAVDIEVYPFAAMANYKARKVGLGIGLDQGGDLQYKIKPDFFKWGDESEFAFLENENGKVGNVFSARLVNRTYFFLISGFYFDDPKQWAEFITPKLEYLRNYKPLG